MSSTSRRAQQKASKGATKAATTVGAELEDAASWVDTKLDAGAKAAVDALHTAGRGERMGVDALGSPIRRFGSGIADLGKKIGG